MKDRIAVLDRIIADARALRRSLLAEGAALPPKPRRGRPDDPWLEPLRALRGAAVELDGAPHVSVTLADALAAVGASPGRHGAADRAARCLAVLGWTRRRQTRVVEGRRGYHYVRPVGG